MLKKPPAPIVSYGTSLALVLAALLLKLYVIKNAPVLPFIIALMLSAWFGGIGPGIFAALLDTVAAGWLIQPKHSLNTVVETALAMGFFLVITQALAKIYRGHLKTADAVLALARGLEERDRQLIASQQNLENETRIQKAILHSIGEGVVVTDASGRFLIFNQSAKNILGIDHNAPAIEKWPEDFGLHLPDTVTPYPPEALPLARALRGEPADGIEVFVRRDSIPQGAWLSVTARPLRDEEGLSKGAVAVFRDVTASKRAEGDHVRAKEAAEQANTAKSEFLSRMSHELRTPLNSILGFAQILKLAELPPRQDESVDYILKGGNHLLGLINEVLDIARIEAGRMSLSPEPVRVSDALEQALDLVRPLAADRKIEIAFKGVNCGDRHVLADRQRLAQVLLNLLSNAVKYNRTAGTVTVCCENASEQRFRINVSDTGQGIAPSSIDKLFSPFERLEAEQSGVEGTGLGLALSKRLVEAMGGGIGVESTVGLGTKFWIELSVLEDPLEELKADSGLAALAVGTSARPGTLLYIEDNVSNLRLMEHIMVNRPEVRLVAAMQGQLGLDLCYAHRPDLILLDLHLPDMGGDQVLKALRQDPRTSSIPVVMVSADATPGQIERLMASGATDYITKPLNVQKLLELIDRTLSTTPHPPAKEAPTYAETNRSK
jgi:PAS domain S-box-containing protein